MRAYVKIGMVLGMLGMLAGTWALAAGPKAQRFGWAIGIKPDQIAKYKELHANAWPEVLSKLRECNCHNYSIYLGELAPGQFYLFSYLEYTGTDFDGDMAKMAADPKTQEWWKLTDPTQIPLSTRKAADRWWMTLEEVFHLD